MWKLTLLQNVDEIPVIVEEALVNGENVIQASFNCENLISGIYPAHLLTFKRTILSNVIGRDVFISVSMEVSESKFIYNALIYGLTFVPDKGG